MQELRKRFMGGGERLPTQQRDPPRPAMRSRRFLAFEHGIPSRHITRSTRWSPGTGLVHLKVDRKGSETEWSQPAERRYGGLLPTPRRALRCASCVLSLRKAGLSSAKSRRTCKGPRPHQDPRLSRFLLAAWRPAKAWRVRHRRHGSKDTERNLDEVPDLSLGHSRHKPSAGSDSWFEPGPAGQDSAPMHRFSLEPSDMMQGIDKRRESGWQRLRQGRSCAGSGLRVLKKIHESRHCLSLHRANNVLVAGTGWRRSRRTTLSGKDNRRRPMLKMAAWDDECEFDALRHETQP